MHNIDRTLLESGLDAFESDQFEFSDGYEMFGYAEAESPFDEVEEMELAANLLEITEEAELDQFFGNVIRNAARTVGKGIKTPVGQAVGGMLKGAAKKYLPMLGGAAGTFLGGPVGGAVGSQLASRLGSVFGLELEGLSPEDQEFELAKQFVRFAGAAAKDAAFTQETADPQTAAKTAVVGAAQKFAPGLLSGTAATITTTTGVAGRSGRWVRRGSKIILFGV
ncbi:MAG TPA: hypothetical protein VHT73_13230 [Thermodesulfobacteriota bacterium]|nr:hypothetical protein [Thermodesulfobacteriota bacterium]